MLEDDPDLGQSYVEILSAAQREVLLVHSFDELTQMRNQALQCSVAFLDISLGAGQPNGLDAFEWLKQVNFRGRIYFLTGHAMSHPLVVEACQKWGAEVLAKPMDIDDFLNMIESRVTDAATI